MKSCDATVVSPKRDTVREFTREFVMATATTAPPQLSVRTRTAGADTVVELSGKLSSTVPQDTRAKVIGLLEPGCRLVLDLSKLSEISGIGARLLLSFVRQVRAVGGTISATGVSPKLLDLVDAAGFLPLFQENLPASPISGVDRMEVPRIDAYPTHQVSGYAVRPGFPIPFGAKLVGRGINFAVYSRHAAACTLVLFEPGNKQPIAEIAFPPEFRVGDMFAMTVFDLDFEQLEYGYRMDGPFAPEQGHRFDRSKVLLDPTARSVCGGEIWGIPTDPSLPYPYRARILPEDFDWEDDRPLGLPMEDLVIYEMHVRGFTKSPSSGVKHPGMFAGMREKIPYLKELGVNCVELLPIFEFDETDNSRTNPITGERLWNYWGYNTIAFFAPNASYATTGAIGLQADELRALVKELHKNGIEVMLDVVFNHTAEGDEHGPTISFRGLDNRTYYMLTPDGHYYNFSGCGNTLNCNNPVVRGFVTDCLRHWVIDYHIDGFRFDLASILGRDPSGAPLSNPPLLEALAGDPVLGRTKLIAEAWDAGGLYQVGSFPAYGRWAEWNGKFRDCLRKFLKGEMGQVGEMANRVVGSPDLYLGRGATASINFVTCHDGFTLADLVSYNDKHNEANGEENRDGANDNNSWNCGAEGPTNDANVNALRRRQIKNALAMLLVSQGVPMLLMGDECGRTQQGNNNAYCQDNALTWLDWSLLEKNAELFRFCKLMIRFRKQHPVLRNASHPGPGAPEVNWHGTRPWCADWSGTSRVLAFQRLGPSGDGMDVVYVAMNMYWEPLEFGLPQPPQGRHWHRFADTSASSPQDICEPGTEPVLANQQQVQVGGRSVLILVAR
jgi:isoamylase